MKLTKTALVLMVLALMSSCVSKRNINYLRDGSLSNTSKLFPNRKFEYRIQVNDVLSIRVLGLDDANARLFNVETTTGGVALTDASLYVNGFSVEKTGNVQLPSVGKMHLQGMTVDEAQAAVQTKINEYFSNATVILKMVSFRVSVLGEVNRPGSYFVYNNQISILEALAQSGGPTEFGDKRHITLMRQSDQGTQALYVDLSSTQALTSEYFYLLPNDVVYVPALRARPARLNLDLFTILLSAVSTAAVVITVVQNSKK